ncbi:4a-hydroxytetrahydrobiopterin dehydratase [Noviherbaspirillum sedimenti]|uniref:Putative pterin-4-alpha-carbinolamine dehydratase n=2 Tax=Noviherbaspirillum sedimenti TaxID=2320865 RepID=A0A3A3GTJ2_9BURK|nr:4a-hydroxytetrahydrobiopterin dehydratase [Noviherbaspirillum sedimenti]RJG04320.1 4a-hydroxytetrahydrobiopterin dehydratase [Noviherbaspirillum sedimenti]
MTTTADLLKKKCRHQDSALNDAQVQDYLAILPDWQLQEGRVTRTFNFKNYYETLAFVNAIAYMIHAEDHHPILSVAYNRCTVKYHTHSVNAGNGGLSENDFICAAKVDAVFAGSYDGAHS